MTTDSKDYMDKFLHQFNQHFLFNALNTIKCATFVDTAMACDLIDDFAKYLRYSFYSVNTEDKVLFHDEMTYVKAYTDIEMARFSKISVEYDIQAEDFYIFPLLVQPLVENAIKHGLCKKKLGGTVKILSEYNEGKYYIRIIDNGVGFDEKLLQVGEKGTIAEIRSKVEKDLHGFFCIHSVLNQGVTVEMGIPEQEARVRVCEYKG